MVLKEQGTKEREGSKNAMKQKEKYFFDKNEVIGNKKRAIKTLDELLEAHIKKAPEDSTTENDSHLKKVNLLSYWINTYCRFIKKEKTFDASKNKVYKRGEIIQVDLGFRIGHEEGGLHYAVVLNKKDSPYSDILTVLPLSSKKEYTTPNKFTIDLGNEIYDKLHQKYMQKFNNSIQDVKVSPNPVYAGEKITIAFTVDTTEADKVQKEIDLMKTGSIGLVSQITTISKIRITKPLHYSDAFAGIKLSDESLNIIDKKICELYIGK